MTVTLSNRSTSEGSASILGSRANLYRAPALPFPDRYAADLFAKCTEQRSVLIGTLCRARRRQITLRIGEFLSVGPKCQAYKIVEALLRQTMIACKSG